MTKPDPDKILLVQAGASSQVYPFRSHPLGIMCLAAAARRERPSARVTLLDMKVTPHTPESVAALCQKENYGIVGVGAFSVHADIFQKTVCAARAAAPQAVLLAGGPHPTCHPENVLSRAPVDAVVAGEGDAAFPQILTAVAQGGDIAAAPGAVVLRNGEIAATPPRPVEDLDSLPFPAWDLIDVDDYARVSSFSILGRRRYMSLFTSRGCPFRCAYCHNIFGKKYRPRSAENVVAEARELIQRYGIHDFDVLDDVFNLDRERVRLICEGLLSLGAPLMLAFPNGLRSDLLDEPTLRLLHRAGARYISFAIETATPRLQKLVQKNLDIGKAARAMRLAARLGIFCNGFLMLGFPTETEEELRATVDFAVKSPLHTAHFLKVTPFEGTALWDMMTPQTRDAAAATTDALKYYDRSFNLSPIPNARFNQLLAAAHRRFYLNPARLLRLFLAHPRKLNLFRFAAFALRRILFASSQGK